MAIIDLNVNNTLASAGWVNANVANLSSSNDVRTTGGIAGEFLSMELVNPPVDFDSLNTVTLKVEARVVGTVTRAKSIELTLRDPSETILQTFTTGSLTSTDVLYQSSAISYSVNAAAVTDWRLRATVLEAGGMADSAEVEIDHMFVTIDYNLAGGFFAAWAIGSNNQGVRGYA